MSSVNDFVSELVRAANVVEKLREDEKGRLLARAVRTIRDLRIEVGIPTNVSIKDAAIELLEAYARIKDGTADAHEVRTALLDAAGMIRDLHIVRDTGTEIQIGDGGGR
ncbi:hypothetical protein [Rhizobium sp. LC145]|uniref:hypothetical protein n=1 Tax=Rhizobium sp. LC145 TaxID=1120688 RepID=UPI000629FBF4|nr:hypothetical protein [Rhizobium sp. LC145]KKX25327.1 hypothetical protein YH62_25625 [Rhizobium sp. LC145]TKT45350.1 hypothetical protein FDR95_25790 [Rhizobiaceae bacterium LC148]